jgi:hypothetical protein
MIYLFISIILVALFFADYMAKRAEIRRIKQLERRDEKREHLMEQVAKMNEKKNPS